MFVVRLIALTLVLSVAGVASSFALCVSGCATRPAGGEHSCHDQDGVSVAADPGACAHVPAVLTSGDLSRHDRPLDMAAPPAAASPAPCLSRPSPATSSAPQAPAHRSAAHRILRI